MDKIHGSWMARYAPGGAGNPGGEGMLRQSKWDGNGENGTGGLLIIYTNKLSNEGKIEANGSKGGIEGSVLKVAGGSSGGGSINIFYAENMIQNGIIEAKGGEEKEGSVSKGGNGAISVGRILNKKYESVLINY